MPPSLEGVPDDMEVSSSYTRTTEVTYYLPDGADLEESQAVTTYDLVAMAPKRKVERLYKGYNDIDPNIFVRTVENQQEYFPNYTLPYDHTVQYIGVSTFYQGDRPIHSVVVDSSFINGTASVPIDSIYDGQYNLPTLAFSTDGTEKYVGDGYEILFDENNRTVTTIELDSNGVWQSRCVEQYGTGENAPPFPTSEYCIDRMSTINGLCAFKVKEVNLSQICTGSQASSRSIEGENTPLEIRVYPNPVLNHFNLSFDQTPSEEANLQLFDVSGVQLLALNGSSVRNLVDISAFPSGLYFLRYEDKGQVITRKIVKQ